MRISQLMLLVLVCPLIPVHLCAQQSTTTVSPLPPNTWDPQAVSLLQKSLAAQVGEVQVSDVTLTGTAQWIAGSDDETGTATLMATAVGDSRLTLSFSTGERDEIRNHAGTPLASSLPPGTTAQMIQQQPVGAWSGPSGVMNGMAGHNVMTDATWFFPAATFGRLVAAPNYTLSYIGPETHDGEAVVHISVSQQLAQAPPSSASAAQMAALTQHLSQMDLYLNSITLLPVALAFNVHPDNNALVDIPTEIQFSNYQPVDGVQVPLHVQRYLNNSLTLDLQFNNATLNSGLASTDFQL
jgi:hypothetical protein